MSSLSRLWHVARTDPARILHADREVVAATLRREAGLMTRRGRMVMVNALSGLADRGEAAEAMYARVLGGHTLNLLLAVPVTAARVAPVSAEVIIARRDGRLRVPAVLRDGGAAAEAVALLGDRPGGIGLEPGRWRILLAVRYADGRQETYTVRHADPGPAEGPTIAAPPCPDTGCRYEIGCTPAGVLTLTVAAPVPMAELTGLRTYATGLRLTGRFVGIGDTAGAALVFTGPDRREHRVPVLVREAVFEADVPVASLADRPGERSWKVWADVPATGRLRVGRFLTDLRSPNTVHRRPNRMVRLDTRAFAMVRASYTAAGGLTLVCAAGRAQT